MEEPVNLGLHSGLPSRRSEEAFREQMRQMPKASVPCLATRMMQRGKATQAEQNSDMNPQD